MMPITVNHSSTSGRRETISLKLMIRANDPTNKRLDNIEMKTPVVGFMYCRPILTKIADVPQHKAAVTASMIPNDD